VAYLERADLQGAKLQGANLQAAYLERADLQGADLRGAYLQGARLQGAKLQGAKLQGADLQRALNLTSSQVKAALDWKLAFYDDDLLKQLGLPPDHNKKLQKKLAELAEKEKAAGGK
jgi:uncharacterized protein YjbI with pentapeptide repeats